MPPSTRYATSGDVSIAYQVHGDGPDLVFSPGFVSHLEWCWEEPRLARFLDRLASFSRLILFDKRGTGLSDPVSEPPTLETRTDDIRAVMDAARSDRASLLGWSEGAAMAATFAALDPSRVTSIVLYGAYARLITGDGWPGFDEASFTQLVADMEATWGDPVSLHHFSPVGAADARLSEWWAAYQRLGASPSMARMLLRWYGQIDIRSLLPSVHSNALVLHRRDDPIIPVEMGRRLAEAMPSATFVEVAGDEHLFFLGDQDPILDQIGDFVAGDSAASAATRYLTTILFVDIVGSTDLAARLGDDRWRSLLVSFFRSMRRQIDRFHGTEEKTTGDGLIATFDGPARAVRCASAMIDAARALGLELRAGVHTGEVEAVGTDLGGIAIHVASRISDVARPGEVVASSTVRDLVVGSGIEFADRGLHTLKGVPGEHAVFAVI